MNPHLHPDSPDKQGNLRDCKVPSSRLDPHEPVTGHSCCHGKDHGHHHDADVKPSASAKYFCPMCAGVESDKPGDCPKCGMALERNPAFVSGGKTIYTCPMHPEVRQDHPGDCPKCGMPLEPIPGGEASRRSRGTGALFTV